MKITKKRIQEIIKEELENAEAAQQQATAKPDQEKAVQSKQQLRIKFIAWAKKIQDLPGIDSVEAKLMNAIINKMMLASNDDNAKRELTIVLKKLGVEL